LLRYRCFACGGDNQTDFSKTPLFLQKFHQQIEQAGKLHRLESALIKAVIHAESGFNANALSPRGAVGLMQLMPATATELAVSDPRDPAANINAGSAYLSSLLRQFDGKLELALAAYNAGPDTVRRYQAVPPYSETQNYVKRVQQLLQRYRAQPAVAG
jgi:soluble lytic murein transglycosylase-like protein